MIPSEIINDIETNLTSLLSADVKVLNSSPVGGGCIHNASRLRTNKGNYFIKWNLASSFDNFSVESKGLQLIKSTNNIKVPEVLSVNKLENYAYLVLEFIDSKTKNTDFWKNFAYSLANLHKNTNSKFGLDYDNYIGSLPQSNNFKSDWISFFIEERLEKQLLLAEKNGYAEPNLRKKFETLYKKLDSIFPVEKPSLIHGDLWSGNFMTGNDGNVVIIDPAVYYGNREIEISFTKLFGGFDRDFYHCYNEAFPLQPDFESRLDLYNLYPLMVHVNIFGTSYLGQVNSILKRYL